MSVTTTVKTESKLKNKEQDIKKAVNSKNLDEVIQKVKAVDNSCSFEKCKARIELFAIECKFCDRRFCTSHGLPEIHGCGEAVRREEKRKMMHPNAKLNQEMISQAHTRLNMKLKQLRMERKKKK
ncbi:unnamed protein product [Acanthoscelides obtectus]|uniref:AN1-type domain-containing protein n=1 Tax=Acanthoscelides obtectus TaxID=200917 RepID=A0A9P0LY71_ACAOB|nr:unnamed protein product [Acanthoscelides obtectus]CAK1645123.1 DNA-binding protein SMUBP-2 [Acanthoscelides obtectus]